MFYLKITDDIMLRYIDSYRNIEGIDTYAIITQPFSVIFKKVSIQSVIALSCKWLPGAFGDILSMHGAFTRTS